MPHAKNHHEHAGTRWSPPDSFDGYRKLGKLGKGGMGEVFLCHDSVLDRPVAIKFISSMEPDAAAREMFLNEARAAARLQHPQVVTVYRVGEIDGHPYIVSEYIRGENLARLPKPISWPDALELGLGLSRGLAAAHRRGILHRDIKPSNAILSLDGEVKLVDFGLAKVVSSAQAETERLALADLVAPPPAEDPTADLDTKSVESWPTEVDQNPAGKSATGLEGPATERSDAPREGSSSARNIAIRLGLTQPQPYQVEDPDTRLMTGSSERASTIRGTPRYMPPEVLAGESATRRGDVYSLGALLYELCVGVAPHAWVSLDALPMVIQTTDLAPIRKRQPLIDERFAAIIDRCLRRDARARFASAEDLLEALEQLSPKAGGAAIPEGNPYRGLLPFEAEHRALFFGRQQEVGTLLDWLRSDSFVLIVADSGAGKSSLCRAGVLPLVTEGALGKGQQSWLSVSMVPGRQPIQSLSAGLAAVLNHPDFSEEGIAQRIHADPSAFGRSLNQHLGPTRGLTVFVDQLEELVSIAEPAQAAQVAEALASLVQRLPSLRLLATVRSDFLARCATLPGLGSELTRPLFFLKPLNEEGIREAIVGPARAKGVTFQREEMVDHLVQFTLNTDGALPLLQFALAELWTVRQEAEITPRALESIGGVEGALARHGDKLLGTLQSEQRKAARRILMSLVTLEGTRTRRTQEELVHQDPAGPPALEALVKGRLLVGRESPEGALYEVAHEALIKGWRTLAKWLEEAAESRAVKHRLEVATNDWHRQNKSNDALWNLRQVAEADVLEAVEIRAREKEFLSASRRQGLRARRIRRILAVTVPLLIAALFVGARLNARRDIVLRIQTSIEEGKRALQKAEEVDANASRLRKDAFATFDSGKEQEGEVLWSQVLEQSQNADGAYAQAVQHFESALSLDSNHSQAKELLSTALYQRALVMEGRRNPAQAEELIQRIRLYDPSGRYWQRWRAPGHFDIDSMPQGASVKLSRFELNNKQKFELIFIKDLGKTPLKSVEIDPGSMLLELDLPGRIHVNYPLAVNRDENAQIQVDLPRSEDIPAGFVYVPGGLYLHGSAADEDFRKGFLKNVPMHTVKLGNYLIAKHETTNQQWIDFMKSLPVKERAAQNMMKIFGAAGNVYKQRPDGIWEIAIPVGREVDLSFKEGVPVIYSKRKFNQVQDWLKMPISFASFAHGQSYADWLNRSGRLPGAVVCDEYQWERAAKGADNRAYPHGFRLDPGDANFNLTYEINDEIMGVDEVGLYPKTSSIFGADDLVGNVSELVRLGRGKTQVCYRGGVTGNGAADARLDYRGDPIALDVQVPYVGFRICAPFPLPPKPLPPAGQPTTP